MHDGINPDAVILRRLTTCIAAALTVLIASGNEPRPARPNVLFIAVDDLNDWVSPLGGHPLVKTPNLERLAKRGVTFTNAHCQAPVCNPSRTSVLTGLRPSTTGIYALNSWFRSIPRWKDHVTLPQAFMREGYDVVTTGKIYHDAYPPKEGQKDGTEFTTWGLKGGFAPLPAKRIATPYSGTALIDWGVYPNKDEECHDYDVVSYAVDRLNKGAKDRPLFLCAGIRHPHVPLYAPQKWFDLYPANASILPPVLENDRDDVPACAWNLHWRLPEPRLPWLKEHHEWEPKVRAYLASVSFADSMIGRLLDALEKSGLDDNTIIVLWSDHGYHLGEKDITGKNSLWERSTRVPLLISGPGIARSAKCSQPAELIDIFPTLLATCGLPQRDDLEGRSLLPQLRDVSAPRETPAITTHGPDNHAVRSERYRYIRYANGEEELYDMAADPNEWKNLAGDPNSAGIIADHRKWLPKVNAKPAGGGKSRLLEYRDHTWFWEGKAINGPVPMDDQQAAH